jgi:hypothetical protein
MIDCIEIEEMHAVVMMLSRVCRVCRPRGQIEMQDDDPAASALRQISHL